MKDFNSKVAVITGAGGGVGSALAQRLADRRCNLALVENSEPVLRNFRKRREVCKPAFLDIILSGSRQ